MLTTGVDEFTWTYHHQLAFELLKTLIDVTNQYLSQQSQQPQQPQHPDQLNSTSGNPKTTIFNRQHPIIFIHTLTRTLYPTTTTPRHQQPTFYRPSRHPTSEYQQQHPTAPIFQIPTFKTPPIIKHLFRSSLTQALLVTGQWSTLPTIKRLFRSSLTRAMLVAGQWPHQTIMPNLPLTRNTIPTPTPILPRPSNSSMVWPRPPAHPQPIHNHNNYRQTTTNHSYNSLKAIKDPIQPYQHLLPPTT